MTHNYLDFQETVWDYYRLHGRDLPWRRSVDPYKILVSEVMLQQTQASRVIPKYEQFLKLFPDVLALAKVPQQEVLIAWSGLGYNRRARFLHQAAQAVAEKHGGHVPQSEKELVALPGIGINTARAVLAYAFNQPVVFIETNIRTVFIYHFFADKDNVADSEILKLVEMTLPQGEGKEQPDKKSRLFAGAMRKTGAPAKPVLWGDSTVGLSHNREWYWALMDYGSHLKATIGNVSRHSKHYAKQSAFHGSKRQIRGAVLKLLLDAPKSQMELAAEINDDRLEAVLQDLIKEALITLKNDQFSL